MTTPHDSMIPTAASMNIVTNIAENTISPPAMTTTRLPNIPAKTLLIRPANKLITLKMSVPVTFAKCQSGCT